MSIQQMLLGVGVVDTKTYVDDVFSTFVYAGDGGNNRVITNNIDLTEGGLIWTKSRNSSELRNYWYDTVRGKTKRILSDGTDAESTETNDIRSFDSTGYKTGSGGATNAGGYDYASWTFRKTPGFCDIISYSGNNSSNRAISHSLGSAPGLILVKCTSTTKEWQVWNRDQHGKVGVLDTNAAFFSNASRFPTIPTSTNFYVGNDSALNDGSSTYVAYVFAGGESTAATARSVDFDGTGDRLTLGATSDFDFGTGDWTIEGWWKSDQASNSSNAQGLFGLGDYQSTGGMLLYQYNGSFFLKKSNVEKINISSNPFDKRLNQWVHVAVVKSGSTVTLYLNGDSLVSYTDSGSYGDSPQNTISVGGSNFGHPWFGWISNFRVVKGTAVYTSSFRPPTEPLTNITNTKLLCCNNSSTTGATVTPGTITAHGDPTASTDSPFDDPAGFVFGKNEDQNVIKNGFFKCDSNGQTTVNLGWEPQWAMWKKTSGTGDWGIYDAMRGVVTGEGDQLLRANATNAEVTTSANAIDFTPTGFKVNLSAHTNGEFIYTCIRRSDGYVGKPPSLGTGVFAMDTGAAGTTIPNYDSGFPVDMAIDKYYASTGQWYLSGRLTGTNYLRPDDTTSELSQTNYKWDSNVGWGNGSWQNSSYQSWMFKRHAGFDVVAYEGNGIAGRQVAHNLGVVPEMMWIKNRSDTQDWIVYHKGLNGGSNPENYFVRLNTDQTQGGSIGRWNNTAPTSSHFTLGSNIRVNENGDDFIGILFSSVSGISAVGSYTGNGSTSTGQDITTGFQPRFVLIKCTNNGSTGTDWVVLDTTRGWGSGNDKELYINSTAAQVSNNDLGAPLSTGFNIKGNLANSNENSGHYIYYAHA